MPPRLPLRCHPHDNSQHVLKLSSRRRLRFSTSAALKSADTSTDTSADTNASSSGPYAKDEGQTWRMRADGKRKLPLPPILDPVAISQRERWTEPKKPAAAPAERTPFQKKLHNNAFAHMLSTPVREDHKLWLQLPSHFLVPFRPLKHPSTADIWLLPGAGLKPSKAAGSFTAWALGRRAHLRALSVAKRGAYRGLTGPVQGGSALLLRANNTVWRADMDELVLRMLRENVVKQLRYGFSKPRGGGVIARLWEQPGRGFVPYNPSSEHERPPHDPEREEQARRTLPQQLSQHAAPAALLFLRPLTPLSARPSDALNQHMAACDGLVDDLVDEKLKILRKKYPDYSPPPHSPWAHAERLYPRLDPRWRVGRLRPSVVRWTPADASMASEASRASKDGEASEASKPGAVKHAHLVPVYSLPDLLGGEEALSALLGGEQSERSQQSEPSTQSEPSQQSEPSMQSERRQQRERIWGRGAVLLKAGPGAIGALLALERLRSYVEVPW